MGAARESLSQVNKYDSRRVYLIELYPLNLPFGHQRAAYHLSSCDHGALTSAAVQQLSSLEPIRNIPGLFLDKNTKVLLLVLEGRPAGKIAMT